MGTSVNPVGAVTDRDGEPVADSVGSYKRENGNPWIVKIGVKGEFSEMP